MASKTTKNKQKNENKIAYFSYLCTILSILCTKTGYLLNIFVIIAFVLKILSLTFVVCFILALLNVFLDIFCLIYFNYIILSTDCSMIWQFLPVIVVIMSSNNPNAHRHWVPFTSENGRKEKLLTFFICYRHEIMCCCFSFVLFCDLLVSLL